MKKKFIFLTMMLLTFLGVNLNVLNAQGIDLTKQYRIKVEQGGYAGKYLHVNSFNAPNNQPQVGIANKSESTNQIFTLEDAGNGNYYLKCATYDYYIKCAVGSQWWCVYAYSTTEKTPIYFDYTDGTQFYLRDYDKMMGIGGDSWELTTNNYFKVENESVYCDAGPDYTSTATSYVTTWSLEEVVYSVAVSADATEIWSDETVNLTAIATGGAGSYTYNWSPATGLDNASSATPVFTPSAVGTYTFTCTATDANGATATSEEISILVKDAKDKPKTENIVFTLKDSYGDGWNGGYLTVVADDGTNEKLQLTGGTSAVYTLTISQAADVTVTFIAGNYTSECSYTIYYEDGEKIAESGLSCYVNGSQTFTFTVKGNIPLTVTAAADKYEIMDIETVRLTATAKGGVAPYSYNWSPATGLDNPTSATPIFTPEGEGVYEFICTVTDAEGTVETASVTITVNDGSAYCVLKLTLEDTYGDGWNNNYLTVEYGTTQETVTLEDYGSYKEVQMIVLSGSEVTVTFHGVAYTYENILTIECGNVYKKYIGDGSSYAELTDGVSYTFTADCKPAPAGLTASKTQLYPNETTTLTWDAFEGALSYNIYVNDELRKNTTETTYELSNIPYENTITVEAVLEGGEFSGKASISVQVAGTFNLVLNVKDIESQPIDGATVTIKGYDEFDAEVSEEFITIDGKVEETLYLPEKETQYTIEVNKQFYGTQYTEVANFSWSGYVENASTVTREVTLQLNGISNVNTDKEYYDENEAVVLSWAAIEGATYNVYVNDEETPRNAEPLTSASYTIEDGLQYKESGNRVYVTAVYPVGESDKGSGTYINVNGYGKVLITVTDGVDPIAGANVVIKDYNGEIELITSADGTVEKDVVVGFYTITASKYNYEGAEQEVSVAYQDNQQIDFVLISYPEIDFDVTATNVNDEVTVTWDAPEGATQYNVFRKDATEEVVKLTETPITEQEYLATDWAELTNGTYQYGVSAFVGGGSETLLSTGFENDGKMPEGWEMSSRPAIVSTYAHTGNYSFRLQITGFSEMTGTLTSPEITIGDIDPTLSFYYINKNDDNTTGRGKINVQVEIVGTGTFTEETIENETNDFVLYEKKLEGYNGRTIKIKLELAGFYYAETIVDDIVVSVGSSPVEHQINWSNAVEKTSANVYAGIGDWNDAANWSNGVPANDANVFIEGDVTITTDVEINNVTINENATVTIDADASLTVVNAITNKGGAANLVINDGAQLFQDNDNVLATFVMNITAPNNWDDNMAKDGWQFVASPMTNASIAGFLPEEGEYDFYKYDGYQDLEWRNIKADGSFETEFQQATGYLVSFENAASASVAGILNKETTYSWDGLNYDATKPLANFNLLGNPFPFDMQWNKIVDMMWHVIDGYAVVNNYGGYDYFDSNSEFGGVIKAGDAFFVETNGTYPSMYYDHKTVVEVNRAAETQSVNLIATGSAGKDNVIINLNGKSEGFSKLQNLNDNIANIFVKDAGMRYGIFGFEPNTEEVEIAFDAKEIGSYTISAVAQGDFSSVILVDRVTGAETNLLTGSYTFMANSSEDHDRFVVRFSQDTTEVNFVYQANEDLIINAEGTVQIIDVMGRIVYSNEVVGDNNRINVSNFGNAAYMVRVINEEGVKVQKVVIY